MNEVPQSYPYRSKMQLWTGWLPDVPDFRDYTIESDEVKIAIVDENGAVQFHSIAARNLTENFIEECGRNQAILAKDPRSLRRLRRWDPAQT